MLLTMDSTFKRAIFIAVVIAVSLIFFYYSFFYQPEQNQNYLVIYLVLVQSAIVWTFFKYRDHTTARLTQIKRLNNPRLQENAFEFAKLLIKEFEYIRETASQAMNDRHKIVNFFLLISGAIVSIIGSQLIKTNLTSLSSGTLSVLIVFSIFLNIIGWIYFMHLIRLRQAWWSSAEAMNQIKEFYIINGRVPDDIARSAFLWDSRSMPSAGKKSNVFYYSTMLINFVSTSVLFSASYLLTMTGGATGFCLFTAIVAGYHFIFQMVCYSLFLDYRPIR
jgi:hypothetical protein